MLERLNIKTTTGNHYRKYFFNFNFFEKINNEFKAYQLGFMYADGCILKQDNREDMENKNLRFKLLNKIQNYQKNLKKI